MGGTQRRPLSTRVHLPPTRCKLPLPGSHGGQDLKLNQTRPSFLNLLSQVFLSQQQDKEGQYLGLSPVLQGPKSQRGGSGSGGDVMLGLFAITRSKNEGPRDKGLMGCPQKLEVNPSSPEASGRSAPCPRLSLAPLVPSACT